MVENHKIHRELDKRIGEIDSKLKNSFSLIKKDIHEMKSRHLHSKPQSEIVKFYESKLNEARIQSTLDRANLEALYGKKLSALEDKQEELKHTISELTHQIQTLQENTGSDKPRFVVRKDRNQTTAFFQVLISLLFVGIIGYFLFYRFVSSSFTGVIGGVGVGTIASITGALLFILVVLWLLFYIKIRKIKSK